MFDLRHYNFDRTGSFVGRVDLPLDEFERIDRNAKLVETVADVLSPDSRFDIVSRVSGWTPILMRGNGPLLVTAHLVMPEATPITGCVSFIDLGLDAVQVNDFFDKHQELIAKWLTPTVAELALKVFRGSPVKPCLMTITETAWPLRGKAIAFAEWAWGRAMFEAAKRRDERENPDTLGGGEADREGGK